MKKIIFFNFLFGFSILFASWTISGKVIYVYDGDTFKLKTQGKSFRVRLYGIDSPEKKQSYGLQSTEYLNDLIMHHNVRVLSLYYDKYKRIIGKVYIDTLYVNLQMIKSGNAWWYRYFAKNEQIFQKAQTDAQKQKLGLWKKKEALAPWIYRKIKNNFD